MTYCSGFPMVSATVLERAASRVFRWSSARATVVSSFSSGIVNVYDEGAFQSSPRASRVRVEEIQPSHNKYQCLAFRGDVGVTVFFSSGTTAPVSILTTRLRGM